MFSNKAAAALKYVLTAKTGRFLGVLAEKPGVSAGGNHLFFALFHFSNGFLCCRMLSDNVLQILEASQKNRAQKPTVGFLFFGAYVIMAP
jgi:hypothetical protein